MPSTLLRHIAIHVEEPAAGQFCWVLTEHEAGQAWHELRRAPAAVASYQRAMADGLVALESLIEDLDRGPRRARSAPATRAPAPAAPAPAGKPARRKRSFFGFGPAR